MLLRTDSEVPYALPPVRSRYYPSLDGLRAVAFLMVFAQHYFPIDWGWSGVDVFFVLSGFLITGILFETRHRAGRFRHFYTRRALRIFPLYYGLFALLYLLTPVLHVQWNRIWFFWVVHLGNYLRCLPPTAFHGANRQAAYGVLVIVPKVAASHLRLGHLWSLCVEEQFYLLWPFVVFQVQSRRGLIALGLCVYASMPLVRWWMEQTLAPDALNGLMGWGMPFRVDSLLLGGALAMWIPLASGVRATQSRAPVSLVFGSATVLGALLLLLRVDLKVPPAGHVWTYTLVDGAAAIVLFEALRPRSILARALAWPPLRWAGRLTYGAYLFHDIPHGFYEAFAAWIFPGSLRWQLWATAAAGLAGTFAAAWVSYRFYESRFLALKDRWARE